MIHERLKTAGKVYLSNMLSITKHADLHLRSWDVGKLHSTTKPLIFLRVIILQSNLQLDCFYKLPLLLLAIGKDLSYGFPQHITLKLATHINNTHTKKIKLPIHFYINQLTHRSSSETTNVKQYKVFDYIFTQLISTQITL